MPSGGVRCPDLIPGLLDGIVPGSVVVAIGTLGIDWQVAARDAVAPGGRVIALTALAGQSGDGLDGVVEAGKVIDLDLLLIAPDADVARVLEKGRRILEIFLPPVLVLGQPIPDAGVIEDIGYAPVPGPQGTILLAADDDEDPGF